MNSTTRLAPSATNAPEVELSADAMASDAQQATGESVITISGLVKNYKIYSKPIDVVKEVFLRRPFHEQFAALSDVNIRIRRGEVVGIMGRNGAGKSTLLKILTGVLDYDAGKIVVDGEIAAILELGAGINPEYTGIDNIIYGTMVRGYSREYAESLLEDIIEFSELRPIIHRQFRTYSSGQKARLLFSIAIAVDADILIIDEALAAGDVLFAEKCFKRMKDIAASGKTVIFVTHALGQIYELCTRAILMHQGRVLADGEPRNVGYEYETLLSRERDNTEDHTKVTGGSGGAKDEMHALVASAEIVNQRGTPVTILHHGERYIVRCTVQSEVAHEELSIGFRVERPSGLVVFGTSTALTGDNFPIKPGETITVDFGFDCRLGGGDFVIGAGLAEQYKTDFRVLQHESSFGSFSVVSNGKFAGLYEVPVQVMISREKNAGEAGRPNNEDQYLPV